jgi:putative spermidine/putrescine transport system substrate-binding protein
MKLSRRDFMGGAATLGAAAMFGGKAFAALPAPSGPLSISIVDVAGNLALTQGAFDAYAKANPTIVSSFVYSTAPAPDLPAKLQAQEAANHVDIDLVLTGTDDLSAGISQGLWIDLTQYMSDLPDLASIYLPQATKMQALAQNQGITVSYYPSGPLIEYMPDAVQTVPTTAQELLDWAKQNPNQFMYARPANSGPGRTLIMGLPYILGDKDPMDPTNGWDKTWAYLDEIGQYVEYYGTGTTQVMKELGQGTRSIVASTTGWDINPRVLGIVPAEAKIGTLKGFHWVTDAHYMCIPKGLAPERVGVLLKVMNYMLTKPAQAFAYDKGYFYPGPAVAGVTLDMAPQDSQDAIKQFGRPEYDDLIANNPMNVPLGAQALVTAFSLWDQKIGAKKSS